MENRVGSNHNPNSGAALMVVLAAAMAVLAATASRRFRI